MSALVKNECLFSLELSNQTSYYQLFKQILYVK